MSLTGYLKIGIKSGSSEAFLVSYYVWISLKVVFRFLLELENFTSARIY